MPAKRKLGALYFTGITRIDKGGVALTGHYYASEEKEEQRTAFLTFRNGTWGGMDVAGISHTLRFTGNPADPNRQYLILERNRGLYRFTPPSSLHFERIHQNRKGFLMDLRKVAGNWYAVGGHYQVYREVHGVWDPIDDGIYLPGEEGDAKLLTSIHGLTDSDIYTVGFNGIILHYDGMNWTQVQSPTNVGIQRVLCVSNDEIYICGNANGLYRGNRRQWAALTEADERITFWDMAAFKGRVYACTKKELFVINGNSVEKVEIPVKGPLGFYRMDSDQDELWTCGNECLLQFDGENWKQHIFPDNE